MALDTPTEPSDVVFSPFTRFPTEIRAKIWEASITPRIIRCQQKNSRYSFTAPSKTLPLLITCRESRETAFFYGCYILISTSPCIYFSPKLDYLLFDVGWIPPHVATFKPPIRQDFIIFLESIDPGLLGLRNIMVHPNWSEEPKMPTVSLAQFTKLARVLVATDEKTISFRTEVLFSTVHDIRMYYAHARKHDPKLSTPRISVGCLGWTGLERWRLRHGSQDDRQLVAVFQDYAAMKEHQRLLREEERMFTRERFANPQPSFMQKLRQAREASESSSKSKDVAPVSPPLFVASEPSLEPPSYEDAISTPTGTEMFQLTAEIRDDGDS